MSSINREGERLEAIRQQGMFFAEKAGGIEECENHPGTYVLADESEEGHAYAIRPARWMALSSRFATP